MNVPTRLKQLFRPSSPRGRRFVLGIGFLALAGLMSASIFATGPEAVPEPRREKAWPVSVMTVNPAPAHPTFRAYGRVESSRVAHLRTDIVAEVAEVHVREGDWVAAGDPIITLGSQEAGFRLAERRAELAELEAALASLRIEQATVESSTEQYRSMRQVAQNKLERHRDLIEKRLISQSLFDEVVAQANLADIEYQNHLRALADFPNRIAALDAAIARAHSLVQQAELDVSKTRVVAPFSGPVLGVFVAPGDRSNLGVTLADVADAAAFEVRVLLPERYADRLHTSLSRDIHAVTPEGLELALSRLSSQVKQGQSGVDAFFTIGPDAADPSTALGRLLELVITLPEERSVIAVPVQSIYENDRIYSVQENRLEAITVERVGETHTETGEYRVLVRSPELRTGDAVITTQLPRAIEGLLVEPA